MNPRKAKRSKVRKTLVKKVAHRKIAKFIHRRRMKKFRFLWWEVRYSIRNISIFKLYGKY